MSQISDILKIFPLKSRTYENGYKNYSANCFCKFKGLQLTFQVVFLGFFICFLPQLQSRADVDDWTVDGDADVAYLKEFKSLFPKQDFFVVAYQEDDLFTRSSSFFRLTSSACSA
jgi:hypothetical protein